jgi:hypothetical protein
VIDREIAFSVAMADRLDQQAQRRSLDNALELNLK